MTRSRLAVLGVDTSEHMCYHGSMNVRLGKYEQWVQDRVDSGEYSSTAEVVRAGLRLLKEEEEWRSSVRAKIAEGITAANAGRFVDGDAAMANVRARLDELEQNQ